MKPRKWKTLKSDVAYSTPIFDLHRRRSMHARRGERDFFILDAPNWVNIIPLAKNGDVVMIRQWRHGISEFTLEVPGGMVDPEDESPMHAARREMIEETGFDSDAIVALGKVHPNPAIQGNICFSFLAENVRAGRAGGIDRRRRDRSRDGPDARNPRPDRVGQSHARTDNRRILVPARLQPPAQAPPPQASSLRIRLPRSWGRPTRFQARRVGDL